MALLENKALQIAGEAKGGEMIEVAIDPITIMAIINLIVEIMKMFKDCKKTPTEAKVTMSSPNWIQKWRLRGMIRQELKKHGSKEDPNAVLNSILNQGNSLSVQEVAILYAEADAHLALFKK